MSKSVKAALMANGAIAIAKGVAAFLTGSASMMAEAIHSTADCGNQALVMFGEKQASRGRSEAHSFGQGKANFFWSFVVAVVFSSSVIIIFSCDLYLYSVIRKEKIISVTTILLSSF